MIYNDRGKKFSSSVLPVAMAGVLGCALFTLAQKVLLDYSELSFQLCLFSMGKIFLQVKKLSLFHQQEPVRRWQLFSNL